MHRISEEKNLLNNDADHHNEEEDDTILRKNVYNLDARTLRSLVVDLAKTIVKTHALVTPEEQQVKPQTTSNSESSPCGASVQSGVNIPQAQLQSDDILLPRVLHVPQVRVENMSDTEKSGDNGSKSVNDNEGDTQKSGDNRSVENVSDDESGDNGSVENVSEDDYKSVNDNEGDTQKSGDNDSVENMSDDDNKDEAASSKKKKKKKKNKRFTGRLGDFIEDQCEEKNESDDNDVEDDDDKDDNDDSVGNQYDPSHLDDSNTNDASTSEQVAFEADRRRQENLQAAEEAQVEVQRLQRLWADEQAARGRDDLTQATNSTELDPNSLVDAFRSQLDAQFAAELDDASSIDITDFGF